MYLTHQAEIKEYAWKSADHLADLLVFARMTVRRQLVDVPSMMKLYREGHPRGLTVQTRDAVAGIHHQKHRLYDTYRQWYQHDPDAVFRDVLSLYGFGMAKAGFVVQMVTGTTDYGCLDVHNLRRYGLSSSMFRTDAPWQVVEGRMRLYKSTCRDLGGSQVLWDTWCDYVAALYSYPGGAEAISALHVKAVVGEESK